MVPVTVVGLTGVGRPTNEVTPASSVGFEADVATGGEAYGPLRWAQAANLATCTGLRKPGEAQEVLVIIGSAV